MDTHILQTKGLEKHFGRVRILRGIDIEVNKGSLHAIIGPNGAGKTTLFNAISGRFPLSAGRILFNGADITDWAPEQRLKAGIARAFQIINIFPNMTVLENLILPTIIRHKKGMKMFTGPWKHRDIVEEAERVLSIVGLEKNEGAKAGSISHGDKKKLDIALALATNPKLLLLDEPTAGVSPEETRSLVDLVKQLNEEHGTSIIFIEHNMRVVLEIAEMITVLADGMIIAQGEPREIKEHRAVIDAYLGEEI
jgi:branched-chain amino acid transport system ATP-binding protein